jgi:two-component system, NtrC family, sensor kinase
MRTEKELEYLLKAINAFRKKMIVISPEFEILAARCSEDEEKDSEIVGRRCYEEFYNHTEPCEHCAAKLVLKDRRPALQAKPDESTNMESMPCFYAYPILDGDRIEALVSMDFDLPTRTELEAKLQRTNALLRNLILSAVDGVIAANRAGKILIFNETASEVFGYSVEEALDFLDIRDIYKDGVAYEVMEKLRSDEFGGKGKLRSYQVEVVDKSGQPIPISLNAAIVYMGDQEVATIGFFHDLRETMQIKGELEKTQIQLLQAEKMASLGKLAAGVAHQLNNPIGGITLFTKLVLEEYDLETGVREDLNRVLKDAERCRDTVKELLEFTRQTRHLMQPHDINKAISRTLFLLENQTLFHNIEIEKDLAETLPPVHSDIQQLNHLFMNIILNAAQAMEGQGRLRLKTALKPSADRVLIEISDSGPGIDEQALPHIFAPFYTTKEEGEGTGLGLSLVYNIVETHGGTISARNQKGGGAVFVVELPLEAKKKGENGGP